VGFQSVFDRKPDKRVAALEVELGGDAGAVTLERTHANV
jgi:hypothetical protein